MRSGAENAGWIESIALGKCYEDATHDNYTRAMLTLFADVQRNLPQTHSHSAV
jgi:hypothetical protein